MIFAVRIVMGSTDWSIALGGCMPKKVSSDAVAGGAMSFTSPLQTISSFWSRPYAPYLYGFPPFVFGLFFKGYCNVVHFVCFS